MNHPPVLFMGVLAAMGVSWFGMILVPNAHLGAQQPGPAQVTGNVYPQARAGLAEQGREVYRKLGCVSCHTQQVRPIESDLHRFGAQPTVAQDYLFDRPTFIGSLRVGPDLANIGARSPDAEWHFKHLFDPQATVPGSTMPPYPFLFDSTPGAAETPGAFKLGDGRRLMPKPDASSLVAYLLSLRSDAFLFERPAPQPPPPPPGTDTNAPAMTNSPAK